MQLELISYPDLTDFNNVETCQKIKNALCNIGVMGVTDIPHFQEKSLAYTNAAQQFSVLTDEVKQQYAPDRDAGNTEGYELGAEWFKDKKGEWQKDDKKSSFYAFVPDRDENKWPKEIDLKTPYQALGKLIFETGKRVLNFLGLNDEVGIKHDGLVGYGRMLHYHKVTETIETNPNWCGAHFDHGILSGLIPAYYFREGIEIKEPDESGLFILPTKGNQFEKVNAHDKSVLLFQVGEFGQLATHDQIRATKHLVKKAKGNIERFTFALFFSAAKDALIHSKSELTKDSRYTENMSRDGSICYDK